MSGASQTAIISIAGSLDPSVKKAIAQANKSINVLKVGIAVSAAAIGAATAAAGKYLLDLGKEMDSCYDAIRIGTGATGDALEGLKDDFKAVYSEVPGDAEQAAQAVADFNTRLGLSGEELQGVSKQAMFLSNNLGAGELGGVIESSSKAFQNWNIPADQMAGKMDYLFKVSQSTGTGYQELAVLMQQNGQVLQELGYDFDTASTLIGQMDKAGVNTTETLSMMKKSLAESAKAGVSASDAFQTYYNDIMNAKDSTEAANIASELFGTKGGPQMALAIRSGAMNAEMLTKSLQESGETISGVSWDTMDYAEKLQLMKQKMSVALAPLGDSVFDSMNALLPLAQKGIELLIPVIQKIGKNIPNVVATVSAVVQKAIGIIDIAIQKAKGVIQAIMPTIKSVASVVFDLGSKSLPVLGKVLSFVSNNMSTLLPIISGVAAGMLSYKAITLGIAIAEKAKTIAMVAGKAVTTAMTVAQGGLNAVLAANPIGAVCTAIGILVAAGVALYKNWDVVKAKLSALWQGIKNFFIAIPAKIGAVYSAITGFVDGIVGKISNRFPIIGAIIGGMVNAVKIKIEYFKAIFDNVIGFFKNVFTGNFSGALENLKNIVLAPINYIRGLFENIVTTVDKVLSAIGEKFPALGGIIESVRNVITPIVDSIRGVFEGIISFVQNVFSGQWGAAWQGVKDMFSSAFGSLAGLVKQPLNTVISLVNGAINAINSIGFTIPDWVPLLGGKQFSVNIPNMPMLATGGIATKPSIVGEGGYPEYVITTDPKYRNQNIDLLGSAMQALNTPPVAQLVSPSASGTSSYTTNNTSSKASIVIEYKPNITIQGAGEQAKNSLMQLFDEHSKDIADKIKSILRESEVGSYGFQW